MSSSKGTFSYAQAAKGLGTQTPNSSQNVKSSDAPSTQDVSSEQSRSESNTKSVQLEAIGAVANDTAEPVSSTENSHTRESFENEQSSGLETNTKTNGLKPSATSSSPTHQVAQEPHGKTSQTPPAPSTGAESKALASSTIESSGEKWETASETSALQHNGGEAMSETSTQILLQEAPLPAVNVWQKRAEARAATAPAPVQTPRFPKAKGNSDGYNGPSDRFVSKQSSTSYNGAIEKNNKAPAVIPANLAENSLDGLVRSNNRMDDANEKRKAPSYSKPAFREGKTAVNAPLPPTRDQASWPTPENVEKTERRKSEDKTEKGGDEPAEKKKSHGKKDWVAVPFTPTVVFNTPLPTTGRRGGRQGARGGRDGISRGPPGINTSSSSVTDQGSASSPISSLPNGDQQRRGRSEGSVRGQSPAKGRATDLETSDVNPVAKQTAAGVEGASGSYSSRNNAPLTNGYHRRGPSHERNGITAGFPSSRGNGRGGRGRRGDFPHVERRRLNGEDSISPGAVSSKNGEGRESFHFQEHGNGGPGHSRRAKSISEDPFSPTKSQGFDRRNAPYFAGPAGRDRGEPRGRGSLRGGRGGHYSYSHGHSPSNSQSTNGQSQSMSQFALPQSRSPPNWQSEQPGPFYPPPHVQQVQQQRPYRGTPSRVQSLPTEQVFSRYSSSYGVAPPMQPMQPYMTPFEAQAAQAQSVNPYGPYPEQYSLLGAVTMQLEYYFSVDNLCKDMFLRKNMDSKGFVPLTLIAGFNRVQRLTTDVEYIKSICSQSPSIDLALSDSGEHMVRAHRDWERWVLQNMEEREPTARNDGPSNTTAPVIPLHPVFDPQFHQRLHSVPSLSANVSPSTPAWMNMNGTHPSYSPLSPAESQNGQFTSQQSPFLNNYGQFPLYGTETQPRSNPQMHFDPEADSFSDAQAGNLTVFVKGSAATTTSDEKLTNGNSPSSNTKGSNCEEDGANANGTVSPSGRIEEDQDTSTTAIAIGKTSTFWVKNNDQPVDSLPSASECERYYDLYAMVLKERDNTPSGQSSHNLGVLYGFWAHFLVRNFNSKMYQEFHRLALEDRQIRDVTDGFEALLSYYRDVLSNDSYIIRETVARDYVELVKEDLAANVDSNTGSTNNKWSAFRQLRSQWRDGATSLRNRKKLGALLDETSLAALEATEH